MGTEVHAPSTRQMIEEFADNVLLSPDAARATRETIKETFRAERACCQPNKEGHAQAWINYFTEDCHFFTDRKHGTLTAVARITSGVYVSLRLNSDTNTFSDVDGILGSLLVAADWNLNTSDYLYDVHMMFRTWFTSLRDREDIEAIMRVTEHKGTWEEFALKESLTL